jgi:hypothetical protein
VNWRSKWPLFYYRITRARSQENPEIRSDGRVREFGNGPVRSRRRIEDWDSEDVDDQTLLLLAVRRSGRALRHVDREVGLDPASAVLVRQALAMLDRLPEAIVEALPPPRPHWDRRRRVLTFNGLVVKRFVPKAINQMLLLDVFEECGWPERIDDPLPQVPGKLPVHRLHDTLKQLNNARVNRVIQFGRDGTGTGACWFLPPPE